MMLVLESTIVLEKEFDSNPSYNEKYLNTKITSDEGKINSNFQDNGVPKKGSHCIFLSVILLILFLKREKLLSNNFFIKECK